MKVRKKDQNFGKSDERLLMIMNEILVSFQTLGWPWLTG